MHYFGYKFLHRLLTGLVYGKRALVWGLGRLWSLYTGVQRLYRHTIGFRFVKLFFVLQKKLGSRLHPWSEWVFIFLGKRLTLQVILFLVATVVMVPHTKLYTNEIIGTPGRNTLLYAFVGPGDQDFSIEEVVGEVDTQLTQQSRTWREGAVTLETPQGPSAQIKQEPEEIAGISAGGAALAKPTIISGSLVESQAAENGSISGRREIVEYTVESGDTVSDISKKFQVQIETILWANNLSVRSYIRPGDRLKILPVDGVLYTVKKGDTVLKIAKNFSSDADEIIAFNRLQKDGADIIVGEQLILPGGKISAPVYAPRPQQSSKFQSIVAPPPSVATPAGSGYLWPTTLRHITQYFGLRHTGLDIAGPSGAPVYASRSGTIIKSQCGWNGGYGCYIIIDHGGGVHTLYGHNSQLLVSSGDTVVQGQTIALSGNTGRSTGPHLHFEVRVNGGRQNPLKYIR